MAGKRQSQSRYGQLNELFRRSNPKSEYRNPWPKPDPKGRGFYSSFPNIPETAAYFKLVAPGQAETISKLE